MKVYIVTYNTADKPERRIVLNNASATYKGAEKLFKTLKKRLGDFIVDYEINEVIVE